MNEKKYLQLKDIEAYVIAYRLSNYAWKIVIQWDYFERTTVGNQFVRSVDSISANIAEGFGRYGKRDKVKFYRYSFGSVKEALDWNQKSKDRGLIDSEKYHHVYLELNRLPKKINSLIKFTNEKLSE